MTGQWIAICVLWFKGHREVSCIEKKSPTVDHGYFLNFHCLEIHFTEPRVCFLLKYTYSLAEVIYLFHELQSGVVEIMVDLNCVGFN